MSADRESQGRYWRIHGRPGWLATRRPFSWDQPLYTPRMGNDTARASTGGGDSETEAELERYLLDEIADREEYDRYATTREHIPFLSDDSDMSEESDWCCDYESDGREWDMPGYEQAAWALAEEENQTLLPNGLTEAEQQREDEEWSLQMEILREREEEERSALIQRIIAEMGAAIQRYDEAKARGR